MEFDIWTIVSLILMGVATVASGFWLKSKGKLKQLVELFKQVVELVTKGFELVDEGVKMLDDNKIDASEIEKLKQIFAQLKQELTDVKRAFKILIGKELPV